MRKLNLCSESGFATSSRIPWPPMFPPVSASLLAMKQLVSVSMAAAALIFFSRTNEQTHPRRQRHDSRTDGLTMTLATTTRKSFLASFSHDLGVGTTVAARASERASERRKKRSGAHFKNRIARRLCRRVALASKAQIV